VNGHDTDVEGLLLGAAVQAARPYVRTNGRSEAAGFEARVRARLEKGALEYEGNGHASDHRPLAELFAELAEEGADVAGWSTRILRRLPARQLPTERFDQAVELLVAAAALGARVDALVAELDAVIGEFGS
jgi:hypothetical protein